MSPVTQFNNAPQDSAMKKKNYDPLLLLVTLAFAVVTFYGTVRSTDSVDTALSANRLVRTPGPEYTVCGGEKRRAPNGNVAIATIPQFHGKKPQMGLVEDHHKGANPDEYDVLCNEVYRFTEGEGLGFLREYAIGQCNDPTGCELWRVFNEKPEQQRRKLVQTGAKGGWWTLEQDLYENGKGKTFANYAEDQGVCRWNYSVHDGGGLGNAGGYLAKCSVPVGHLFPFGPGQSEDCTDKDGNPRRIPQSDVIQIYVDQYSIKPLYYMEHCSFCKISEFNSDTHDSPDITKCDGEMKDIDLYEAEKIGMFF